METKELTLSEKLELWKKDTTGKCATCIYAFEISDTNVRCTSLNNISKVANSSYFSEILMKEYKKFGYVTIFTAEYRSRIHCQFWSEKVG